MRLQTVRLQIGSEPTILSDVPWHDDASNGGSYRQRLMQSLGGYFEQDENGMQPKAELQEDPNKPTPDAVRLVDDAGKIIETYSVADLMRDTGMTIQADRR